MFALQLILASSRRFVGGRKAWKNGEMCGNRVGGKGSAKGNPSIEYQDVIVNCRMPEGHCG